MCALLCFVCPGCDTVAAENVPLIRAQTTPAVIQNAALQPGSPVTPSISPGAVKVTRDRADSSGEHFAFSCGVWLFRVPLHGPLCSHVITAGATGNNSPDVSRSADNQRMYQAPPSESSYRSNRCSFHIKLVVVHLSPPPSPHSFTCCVFLFCSVAQSSRVVVQQASTGHYQCKGSGWYVA